VQQLTLFIPAVLNRITREVDGEDWA